MTMTMTTERAPAEGHLNRGSDENLAADVIAHPTGRLDFLEVFGRRFVQEIISDASVIYWRRRAETFEAARPRPGDFRGRATEDELEERDARLALKAEACRDRATLIEMGLLHV